jgi:uncharacterized heparinase superfamily protein
MAIGSATSHGRQFRFAVGAFRRNLNYRIHASALYGWRFAGPIPERLTIAPIDLRTTDPTVALDIFAGRWVFGGEGIDVEGFSVFDAVAPSEFWAHELHAFGWLRHFRGSNREQSQTNARKLIDEWIGFSSHHDAIAWSPETVARRMLAWLSQTPLFLEGCDHDFYRRFMRSVTRQIRYLRRVAYDSPPGLPRLRVMMALATAALCMSDQPRFLKQASRRLDLELVNQVLPDGGHINRNPGAALEALADLLPLRQAFATQGTAPSHVLVSAIERMMPMLRFFRHGDGTFARFNGLGDTPSDLLATVLANDDARGSMPVAAPHSGYQRLQAKSTIVLSDTGRPPPIDFSSAAHAGCMAFEMSVGDQVLITNCGVPSPNARSLRRLARTTAAHSTVALNDTSSCRFLNRATTGDWLREAIISGPGRVDVERSHSDESTTLAMQHDGWVDRYRIVHQRALRLTDSGDLLEGTDSFLTPSGKPVNRSGKDTFAIRFHIHPDIRAIHQPQTRSVILEFPRGERWELEADDGEMHVEESIFMSDRRGNRETDQIVIYGRVQRTPSVTWRLHRTAMSGRQLLPAPGTIARQ